MFSRLDAAFAKVKQLAVDFRANEKFYLYPTSQHGNVAERLLPLLPDAKPPLLINLKSVLKRAGSRHGRRYVFENNR
jgi:hypothetical protein